MDRLRRADRTSMAANRRVENTAGREITLGDLRKAFLARTCNPAVGSYPTNPATVYPIKFFTGSFTETPGDQMLDSTMHRTVSNAVGYGWTDTYLAVDTDVIVLQMYGRNWLIPLSTSGGEAQQSKMSLVRVSGPLGAAFEECDAIFPDTGCIYHANIISWDTVSTVCAIDYTDGNEIYVFDFNSCLPKAVFGLNNIYLGYKIGDADLGDGERPIYTVVAQSPPLARIHNQSGSSILQFNCFEIDTALNDLPLRSHYQILKAINVSSDYAPFGVAAFDIPDATIGWGWVSGICPANISSTNDHASKGFCDSRSGEDVLRTGYEGSARIIKRNLGPTPLTLIQLGILTDVLIAAIINSTVAVNSVSNTITALAGGSISNVHFTHVTGSQQITYPKQIFAGFFRNEKTWRIIGADCET